MNETDDQGRGIETGRDELRSVSNPKRVRL